jgi:hypothetical protein
VVQNAALKETLSNETVLEEIQTSLQIEADDFMTLLSGALNATSVVALTKSLSNLNAGLKRVNQILQEPS